MSTPASAQLADRVVDVEEQGNDESSRRFRLLDGIGDERQRATAESAPDELGRDIKDPVTGAVLGSRAAVVRLVGMQDLQLTGQADTLRAAVTNGGHAGRRDADPVGVVPVRIEAARGDVDLRALDAVSARSEPDRVRASAAGSFKTVSIGASNDSTGQLSIKWLFRCGANCTRIGSP